MADIAAVVLGGSSDPLRRAARARRRVLAVHAVPAAAVGCVMAALDGGTDGVGTGARWAVIGVVAAFAVPQTMTLWVWARWAWVARSMGAAPVALHAAGGLRERRQISGVRPDRVLPGMARMVAVACCWWLEITGLVAALTLPSRPDAVRLLPTWVLVNTVCPATLLYCLVVVTAFRVVARQVKLRLGYRMAELLAPARTRRTGPGQRPTAGRTFPGGR